MKFTNFTESLFTRKVPKTRNSEDDNKKKLIVEVLIINCKQSKLLICEKNNDRHLYLNLKAKMTHE